MKRPFGQHQHRGSVPATVTVSKQDPDAIRFVTETHAGDAIIIDLPREVARQLARDVLDLLAEG